MVSQPRLKVQHFLEFILRRVECNFMVMGVEVVHRLFDGVVGMIGSLGDNSESCCSVVIVRAVGVEVPEVILQQQLVLGQSLYRLQEIVGHFQVATLGEVLKLLQSQKSKSGKLQMKGFY